MLLTQVSMGLGYFMTITEKFGLFLVGVWIINFAWYGLFQVCYLYLVEIVGLDGKVFPSIKWFSFTSLIAQSFNIPILLGEIGSVTTIYYSGASLFQVSLCLGILSFSQVLLLLHMPETAKWLLTNLKREEAESQLNEIARVNRKEITVEVELVKGDSRVDSDGAWVHEDIVRVKFGAQQAISLEKRNYPIFTIFNLNLLPVSPSTFPPSMQNADVSMYLSIVSVHDCLLRHLVAQFHAGQRTAPRDL